MLNQGVDPNSLTADNFRPLKGFSSLNLATNKGYANYNALQMTWVRTAGRYTVNANYTFGKAMGLLYANGGPTYDQFNINNNYGVQSGNRTHIFNFAYSVEMGSPVHEKILGGITNGWQLSGIVQWQSGANLSALSGNGNFNVQYNGVKLPGTDFNVSNVAVLGTSDIQLNPVLTCNPASGLGQHQYINSSCFAAPSRLGQNGPTVLPAMYGPAFFNWDMGLFKNFVFKESKKLQLRFNGYNYLNHPLWSFNGSNLTLSFDPNTGKVNSPLFGTVTQKQGHRVIQTAIKFFF
jgi:hypothetical protein